MNTEVALEHGWPSVPWSQVAVQPPKQTEKFSYSGHSQAVDCSGISKQVKNFSLAQEATKINSRDRRNNRVSRSTRAWSEGLRLGNPNLSSPSSPLNLRPFEEGAKASGLKVLQGGPQTTPSITPRVAARKSMPNTSSDRRSDPLEMSTSRTCPTDCRHRCFPANKCTSVGT